MIDFSEINILNTLLVFLAFGFSFVTPHLKMRRSMLLCNSAANVFFIAYFYLIAGYAGAAAALIALIATSIQALFSDDNVNETAWLRFSVSVVMSVIAVYFCYNEGADLLPLIAIIIVRFVEAQGSPQLIRIGNLLPLALWVAYAYFNEFYLVMVGDVILILSYIYGISKFSKKNKPSTSQ